jgi:asparagine synthase (glutamine-hydrolysing)
MCGIAGVVDFGATHPAPQLRAWVLAMRDTIAHRGPDDAGLWTSADGRVCLAQRRLAIIDLRPEGRQPMGNEDGSVVVTFNGEIYNFAALTRRLRERGHRFATRTDTETLCHLLEDDPLNAVEQVQGMFAFAAWRHKDQELVLARDPFGKKPLYYAVSRGLVAFASELHALRVVPGLCDVIDPVAVQQYLLLQYLHAPRTIYQGVSKLEPGTVLRIRASAGGSLMVAAHRYFHFRAAEPMPDGSAPRDEATAVEELRRQVTDAVRDRLVADVPLGAFLSGGVDSSLVVAVMARELGVRVRTFSIGFKDSPESEHLVARSVAQALGTEHHELLVAPSAVELAPTIADALDEPNADSSCLPVYLLSEFTRRHVTVALSGDGGDELFGGYGRYGTFLAEARDPRRYWRALRRLRRWWSPGRAYLDLQLLNMPEQLLQSITGPLLPENAELVLGWRRLLNDRSQPLIHRLRTLDVEAYLPGSVLAKVDRMSMRFALEVRCPLLDVRLGRWASGLPARLCHDGTESKRLLKRLLARYVPDEVVNRPKVGFGLPGRAWSKERLLELASDLVLSRDSPLAAYLNGAGLRSYLQAQQRPECFSVYQVWGLIILDLWLRRAAGTSGARQAA